MKAIKRRLAVVLAVLLMLPAQPVMAVEALPDGIVTEREDAGYDVKQDLYATNISWKSIYDEFMENYDKVKEITDEIGIKVIRAVENRNIFDPNWEPPRKD